MKATSILFAVIFGFIFTLSQAQSIEKVKYFNGSLKEAFAESSKQNKPIFLEAYTTWCGYCKRLEQTTLTDQNVARFLNQNYINLKVDLEKGEGAQIASKYSIRGFPTMLVLSSQGIELKKLVGFRSADDLLLGLQ